MALIVQKIGTTALGCAGGACDFTSLQSWEDAIATSTSGNLVTEGNSYQGECYKDNEFTGTTQRLLISGETTDATHTITLTTAAGQSFRDDAGVQTNPLRYDASKGVGITSSVSASSVISISAKNVTLSKLQVKNTGPYTVVLSQNATATSNNVYDSCIFQQETTGGTFVANIRDGQLAKNCLFFTKVTGSQTIVSGPLGLANLYNCTIAAASNVVTKPTNAIAVAYYTTSTLRNCAFFGCTNIRSTGVTPTYVTCMTDLTGVTGVTGSKTYANQFQGTTIAAPDFRLKAGADLIDAGTTDTTNAATDIVGTARPQ